VAGLDEAAGGSWMGVNEQGVVAAVLNRTGTLGPLQGKRSRGELVLEALDHGDAVDAASALSALDCRAYRPFNLVVADNRDAFWLAHRGGDHVEVTPMPEGVSMLTARELDDRASPRIAAHAGRFRAAAPPEPERDDWAAWQALLLDARPSPGFGPESAMCFRLPSGFATVCSSVLALPAPGAGRPPGWRFAAVTEEPPAWVPVALG
jgi:hypothetical protein